MSPYTTEPEPHESAAPVPVGLFCHYHGHAACPGPATTLLDEHFQPPGTKYTGDGRLAPDTLNRHIAGCDWCLRRLLGCARTRKCDHAWVGLEGATQLLAQQVARRIDQPFLREQATIEAESRGLRTLWGSPRLDPVRLAEIDNLPGYLRTAMRNALTSWMREEERQQGAWKGGVPNKAIDGQGNDAADPDEPTRTQVQMHDLMNDPEAAVLALDQVATLNRILADYVRELETQRRGADRVALFRYWFDTRMADRPFRQTEAARALQADGIRISQPTVHRWLLAIQFDLYLLLDAPDSGLSPTWRGAATRFFCRPTSPADPTPPSGVGEPSGARAANTDLETGSDHD